MLLAACEASSAKEFAEEVPGLVRHWIPHDSYLISGQDPVTGAICFWLADQAYLAELIGRVCRIDTPLYWYGTGSAEPAGPRVCERPHRLITRLADRRHTLGALTLVRTGACPFSGDEVARAAALSGPVAQALRRFIAGTSLPPPPPTAPGVVTVGTDHTLLGITPTARDTLRVLWPDNSAVDDRRLVSVLWNSVHLTRQAGRHTVSRLPTPDGWLAVHAEPLEPDGSAAVGVTIEPARGELLLPVLAAWYGASPAELGVVRQVTAGLPAKQIARRLNLSLHTVHDHLRSIYRKTGVTGCHELHARLG
ncbi:DNA-binding transcriptional regulator, CsgD family [Amycolatopsis sacchari]|uniref:DNA-binding transcriptional regulator, CsgD family n=2 Tax=Amycolatopsis TaxID=1813 RepID=A0A1I3WNL3_9PSEU|nr:DNA-binding transcriptional regulator, CsgD family [Amycolatopsis sacchari]